MNALSFCGYSGVFSGHAKSLFFNEQIVMNQNTPQTSHLNAGPIVWDGAKSLHQKYYRKGRPVE